MKAGFRPGDLPTRHAAADAAGSHSHVRKSKHFVAQCIVGGQHKGVERMKWKAKQPGHCLKYHIVNTMFDETRLPVSVQHRGRSQTRLFPILSSHMQVTWADDIGEHDEDIIRRPVAMRRATSACMWEAFQARDGDGERMCPHDLWSGDSPAARLRGVLTASDGASTCHLVVKHLEDLLPDDTEDTLTLLLSSFCLQHRTGRVIEEASKRLGVVGPCYCMSRLFAQGDFWEEIRDSMEAVLSDPTHGIQVVARLPAGARQQGLEQQLMNQLFVRSSDEDDDDGPAAQRRALSEQVLRFPLLLERAPGRACVPGRLLWPRAMRGSGSLGFSGDGHSWKNIVSVVGDSCPQQVDESGARHCKSCFAVGVL